MNLLFKLNNGKFAGQPGFGTGRAAGKPGSGLGSAAGQPCLGPERTAGKYSRTFSGFLAGVLSLLLLLPFPRALAENASSQSGWREINGKTYYLNENGQCMTGLLVIDNRYYYFDATGAKAKALGVDVSFYNGTVDWNELKKCGVDFAMIRCGGRGWGTGAVFEDSFFYDYLVGAKKAGLDVGIYFYSTASNVLEAKEEAEFVLEKLRNTELDYPIYFDVEYSGDYPSGRADRISPAQRVQIARAFCETIERAGYQSGVYSAQSFFTEGLDYRSICMYGIWIASYTENNALPNFPHRYDIWQITDSARIPGISGNADIDIVPDN